MKTSDLKIQNNFPSKIIIYLFQACKINELLACCTKHTFWIHENKKFITSLIKIATTRQK